MSDRATNPVIRNVVSSEDEDAGRIEGSESSDFIVETELPDRLCLPSDDDNTEEFTDFLPRQRMDSEDPFGQSADDILLYGREDESNDFEILPDDEDEENQGDIEALAKVDEGDAESVGEDDEEADLNDSKQKAESPPSTPPSTPRPSNRRLFKLAMSPTRKKDLVESPNGSGTAQSREEKGKRRFLPQSVEKAFRAKLGKAGDSGDLPDHDETDGFSSEDSSYGSNFSDGDDWQIFEDDADQIVDFSALSILPNSFLNPPPSHYDYLDPAILKDFGDQDLSTFAWEHHLLTKGLMQLFAERDHIGVEDDVHDTSNVLKMGPLKKRFKQKLWSVKYVEIRKGNLTYYDDKAMKEGKNSRTIVHLRKRTCRCEPIPKAKDGLSVGFAFALIDEGGPKRVWMAKSEEEREGWIRAINQAMIGETDGSLDVPLNMGLYRKAVEDYMSIKNYLEAVETREDYMAAANSLLQRQSKSSALRLPVKWIREEVLEENEEPLEEKEEEKKRDTPNQRVKSTVSDFWKALCSTSVVINGYQIEGNSAYSGERKIGALSRCILEHDKVDNALSHLGSSRWVKRGDTDNFLTEVEAVSHARSILTGALRSYSGNESQLAVENLVRNDKIVSCVQMATSEDLHVDVSFAGADFSDEYEQEPNDLSGWAMTRNKKNKSFKERFFVLSEGVLSLYLEANPRPFGLRGQFVLKDAKVETFDDENLIEIQIKDHNRQLYFEDRGEFLRWRSIIGTAADSFVLNSKTIAEESTEDLDSSDHKKKPLKGAMAKLQKEAKGTGERAYKVMREARDAGMDKIRRILPKAGRFPNEGRRRRPQRRRPTTDMLLTSTRMLQLAAEKREPTVQVMVESNKVYRIITNDPESSEPEVILVVRAKLFQAFLLSGGANGKLARGDEVFEMEFADGDSVDQSELRFLEVPTSL
eukprot:scaffold1481_cov137-Cylindrotheca_fusiformis.AAC.7